jgi:hypothetical protein
MMTSAAQLHHPVSTGSVTSSAYPQPIDASLALRLLLLVCRCGLSPSSLVEMKRNTLAALADCMELEDLQVITHSHAYHSLLCRILHWGCLLRAAICQSPAVVLESLGMFCSIADDTMQAIMACVMFLLLHFAGRPLCVI